jgi:hypothetical protein
MARLRYPAPAAVSNCLRSERLDAARIAPTWTWVDQANDRTVIGRGGRRRVGVEIEFGKLDSDRAAAAVQRRFGGTIESGGPHRVAVRNTELGDFRVELDWGWVHGTAGKGGVVDKAKTLLADLGREVVPTELVTPPMPAGRLPEIDSLVMDFVELGAEGTRSGLFNGFGLHLNPSLAADDLAADPIRRVLQAYLLEAPALRVAIDVDPMRRLLPFVEPFPQPYIDHVLHPDYAPSLEQLIDDYIRFSPTRNRELDLLPLFAQIDEERIRRALPDPRVSARPTFHWRLPNADIEDPNWTVAGQWARWQRIEEMACDTAALTERLTERVQVLEGRKSVWASLF